MPCTVQVAPVQHDSAVSAPYSYIPCCILLTTAAPVCHCCDSKARRGTPDSSSPLPLLYVVPHKLNGLAQPVWGRRHTC